MPRPRGPRNLTKLEQRAIVEGYQQGRKHRELAVQFHVSRQSISNFLKRWRNQGSRAPKKGAGRPRIATRVMDRDILRVSRSNPRLTAPEIAREVAYPNGRNPSVRTVGRRL